ncbi:hypothetical protein PIB30_081484 [Stylosanthes scabra]|uniref:Uncharacterized protein n=1 Tax=Stylosanthes scabra TaxID=79078 RepID=A0ABU6TT46_9FABA|nr:hypothetical protein [Stylosanthes scabra]
MSTQAEIATICDLCGGPHENQQCYLMMQDQPLEKGFAASGSSDPRLSRVEFGLKKEESDEWSGCRDEESKWEK